MSNFFDNNNPFLKIFDTLSPDVKADYIEKGKALYEFIDFETGKLYDTTDQSKSYLNIDSIKRSLQSGLKMEDLSPEELLILKDHE